MVHVEPKMMQVKELVEILLKCDQEADVFVGWCDEHWDDPDYDIYVGIEEEYEESEGKNIVTIGSEAYFEAYKEEDEEDD